MRTMDLVTGTRGVGAVVAVVLFWVTAGHAQKIEIADRIPKLAIVGQLGDARFRDDTGQGFGHAQFTNGGREIISVTREGLVRWWDCHSGVIVRSRQLPIEGAKYSRATNDPETFLFFMSDNTLCAIRKDRIQKLNIPPRGTWHRGAFLTDDKSHLVILDNDRVFIANLDAEPPTSHVIEATMSPAFFPSTGKLAFRPKDGELASIAAVRDGASFVETELPFAGQDVVDLAWNHDGKALAVVSVTRSQKGRTSELPIYTVQLVDPASKKTLASATSSTHISNLVFSLDGRLCAARTPTGTICFTAESLQELKSLPTRRASPLGFDRSGTRLFIYGPRALEAWDYASGNRINPGHCDTVTSAAFSPSATLAATHAANDALILWDVATQRVADDILPLRHGHSPVFIDEDVLAAQTDEKGINLYSISQRTILPIDRALALRSTSLVFYCRPARTLCVTMGNVLHGYNLAEERWTQFELSLPAWPLHRVAICGDDETGMIAVLDPAAKRLTIHDLLRPRKPIPIDYNVEGHPLRMTWSADHKKVALVVSSSNGSVPANEVNTTIVTFDTETAIASAGPSKITGYVPRLWAAGHCTWLASVRRPERVTLYVGPLTEALGPATVLNDLWLHSWSQSDGVGIAGADVSCRPVIVRRTPE